MLTRLTHLALEVKDLDAARAFYADRFGLTPTATTADEMTLPVGETTLNLRRPTGVPRGGLHTHFAFSATPGTYDEWRDRLADLDPTEVDFGGYRSLYVYDPDGNCVEIGIEASTASADGIDAPTGVFEVVLEVADLDRAVETYTALGFDPVDRGSRGGGFGSAARWISNSGSHTSASPTPAGASTSTSDSRRRTRTPPPTRSLRGRRHANRYGGVRVRDGDGHWLTFRGDSSD